MKMIKVQREKNLCGYYFLCFDLDGRSFIIFTHTTNRNIAKGIQNEIKYQLKNKIFKLNTKGGYCVVLARYKRINKPIITGLFHYWVSVHSQKIK